LPGDSQVAFALAIAAGAFAASVSVLLIAAAVRAWRRWRQARIARVEASWREALGQAAADPSAGALAPISWIEFPDFLLLWNRMRRVLPGDGAANTAELLRRHGLDERALRLLRFGTLRSCLIAMATLGHLRYERAWPRLERLSRGRGPVTSFAAARAVLRIEPRRGLEALSHAILQRADWPVARLGSVLAELGPATVTPTLTTLLVSRPRGGLDRVVKLARFGDRNRIAPIMRGWLSATQDPNLVMAALDYVDDPQELMWAMEAARHPEWRVRMAAARALGRIGAAAEIPALVELLKDPVWWVRYHAAQAVAGLKGMTPEELQVVRETARDNFAADMLAHAFAELPIRRRRIFG